MVERKTRVREPWRIFETAEDFGIRRLGPHRIYAHIYPIAEEDVEDLTYCHRYEFLDGRLAPDIAELQRAVSEWQKAYSRGAALIMHDNPDGSSRLIDTRGAQEVVIDMAPADAALYRWLDAATPDARLTESFNAADPANAKLLSRYTCVEQLLQEWNERGLVLRDSGRSLSLAARPRSAVQRRNAGSERPREDSHVATLSGA